jgi:glucoamylase
MSKPAENDPAEPCGLAPGAPGIDPTFTSSDKDMVGCALGLPRLWYTLGHGILNEVYWPRIDIPQIRDLGFIVADGAGFWAEVKRLDGRVFAQAAPGVPLVAVTHRHPRFELTVRICPDPERDVLLLAFDLTGDPALRPYALAAPRLGGTGRDNRVGVERHRGRRILWGEQGPFALALACADGAQGDAFGRCSAGHVGVSDGWQDFARNGAMTWNYAEAGPGNVALMAELPCSGVLALGFGSSRESAATLALASLAQEFKRTWDTVLQSWLHWQERWVADCGFDALPDRLRRQALTSALVLKTHMDKTYPGAMVASLSIPWGSQGEERGGYHLVWPRDLVECAGALLALGTVEEARDTLRYLVAIQEQDGHWFQNLWLGGKSYWTGIQLDEAAFPVLLACALAERQGLDGIAVTRMARRALRYIVSRGPASDQDRWEEDAGVNPFTLATCIAALVAGAELLPGSDADLACTVADFWNSRVEDWTVARGSALTERFGVAGYYVREAPRGTLSDANALRGRVPVKNRDVDADLPAAELVGGDFLQLVRVGLRSPEDPVIRDSVTVIDGMLRVDTPSGPAWRRYNGDGYGEKADGSPFDGAGIGRAWPLLVGERGHYEFASGADPLPFLSTMAAMSGGLDLLPEQVWDAAPLPELGLSPGRPTGSAMPLAWAHAEFLKLAASRRLGRVFDRPEAVWRRYQGRRPNPRVAVWTPAAPVSTIRPGQDLLLLFPEPVSVRWGKRNGDAGTWLDPQDAATHPLGLDLHGVTLDAGALSGAGEIVFTWSTPDGWVCADYAVRIA